MGMLAEHKGDVSGDLSAGPEVARMVNHALEREGFEPSAPRRGTRRRQTGPVARTGFLTIDKGRFTMRRARLARQ